eukprot:451909-Pleurochrysis_carterae.AAC.2
MRSTAYASQATTRRRRCKRAPASAAAAPSTSRRSRGGASAARCARGIDGAGQSAYLIRRSRTGPLAQTASQRLRVASTPQRSQRLVHQCEQRRSPLRRQRRSCRIERYEPAVRVAATAGECGSAALLRASGAPEHVNGFGDASADAATGGAPIARSYGGGDAAAALEGVCGTAAALRLLPLVPLVPFVLSCMASGDGGCCEKRVVTSSRRCEISSLSDEVSASSAARGGGALPLANASFMLSSIFFISASSVAVESATVTPA